MPIFCSKCKRLVARRGNSLRNYREFFAFTPFVKFSTAFDPAEHVLFFSRDASGPAHSTPPERGDHGFWPLRNDYRSIFLLSGPGIKPALLGAIEMVSLKDRFAATLGASCPAP